MKDIDDSYLVRASGGKFYCDIGEWTCGPYSRHSEARRFGRRQWRRAYRRLGWAGKLKQGLARWWAGDRE